MKTILKITKNELSTLFYSPIAWLILIIFTFQSGMAYANAWNSILRSVALGYNPSSLTGRLGRSYIQHAGTPIPVHSPTHDGTHEPGI